MPRFVINSSETTQLAQGLKSLKAQFSIGMAMKSNGEIFQDMMGQQNSEEENNVLQQIYDNFRINHLPDIIPGDAIEGFYNGRWTLGVYIGCSKLGSIPNISLHGISSSCPKPIVYILGNDDSTICCDRVREPRKSLTIYPGDLKTIANSMDKVPNGSLKELLESFLERDHRRS